MVEQTRVRYVHSPMVGIARRIFTRAIELKMGQETLAQRCSAAYRTLSREERNETRAIRRRDTICKLLSWRTGEPATGAPTRLSNPEFKVLASVLDVAVSWLKGDLECDSVYADPLRHPELAGEFFSAASQYERLSRELNGWGEFLPCSVEPERFMHLHHVELAKDLRLSAVPVDAVN